ncbi:hypothetical protein [Atlantibacter hermannii]|nr:hypothetical protein [Atlantibacter hermannii]
MSDQDRILLTMVDEQLNARRLADDERCFSNDTIREIVNEFLAKN